MVAENPSPLDAPSHVDELLADLNTEQRAAASHDDGPLLVVAGAGTGKTATLAHRVALPDRARRRTGPHPAADVLAKSLKRDAAPRRRPPAHVGR